MFLGLFRFTPLPQPGWMKNSGTMNGGTLNSQDVDMCMHPLDTSFLFPANYSAPGCQTRLISSRRFKASPPETRHLTPSPSRYDLSNRSHNNKKTLPFLPPLTANFQNEPQHSNPTYPTSTLSVSAHAQIGTALRSLLNSNGLGGVKIIGYEHNWDNAGSYPVQLVRSAHAAL